MQTVKIASFLTERKVKFKPIQANESGLHRIEKIDFDGNIYLAPVQTNTDMILIKKGDLVISGINVEKGALSIYHGEEDVLASIHYSAYEFDENQINIVYLKWFLKSKVFKNLLLEQTGSGIKKEIKSKHLLPIQIELPSLEVQKDIVNNILAVEDDINSLSVEVTKQEKNISALRQAILQQAVEGKLCEQELTDEPVSVLLEKIKAEKEKLIAEKKIKKQKELLPIAKEERPFDLPHGWKWCRLGEILSHNEYGTSEKADIVYSHLSVPVLRMNNINNSGNMDYTDLKYVSSTIKDLPQLFLVNGDLLFNRTNSYELVGKTGIFEANTKYTFASYLIRLRVLLVNSFYIHKCMNARYFRVSQIEPYIVQQNGQANYNGTKVANTLIPLPPLAEQQRIVEKVDRLMTLCDELEQEVSNAKKYTSQLMEAVLLESFSNKEEKPQDKVINFDPVPQPAKKHLLAAARGNMREDTWENLRIRALALAGEES